MSYQTYSEGSSVASGLYAEQNTAAHRYYQGHYYAPPDVAAAHSNQLVDAAHSQPPALGEYDPFSHSEHQPADPPIPPEDDPPPLPPVDEAPPLPAEDAPPLPCQPANFQDQQPELDAASQYHQPTTLAHQYHAEIPQETAFQPAPQAIPAEVQPSWPAYQHPGPADAQPLHHQDSWQQYQYTQPYQAYSQPPTLYQQPWQPLAQAPPPWQQQQQPAAQPQAPVPWQTQAPVQPEPQAIPASAFPVPQPQPIPRVITDSGSIFLKPGRSSRPKRVSIILRGLPGSGKSYLAKKMKDVEVEQGGEAPRIHAVDDYFVTEVEKEVTQEVPGKKARKRTVREMEYCYEAELEGTYKASLLRAYERTVREARFALVIVDAPNLYADDLKPYWTAGQRGGYEVYIAEVDGSSPETCHDRNAHNRSLADIQQAAAQWQETPAVYPVLDVSLLLGEAKKSSQAGIAEVEMEDNSDSGVSEDEATATAQPPSSKWATAEATPSSGKSSKRAQGQGQGSRKRAKAEAALLDDNDYDGLVAGLDGYFGKNQSRKGMHDNASSSRGVLKKGMAVGRNRGRSVRWADEEPEGQSGFRIGGSRQLETIYVLEGLGPPKDQVKLGKTFKDQIRAEHTAERRAFRDVLLGGRRA